MSERIGTCRWCCDKDQELFRGLCDQCDSNIAYCRICRSDQHYQSKCRHVFQDEYFQWRGAGFDPRDEEMKRPFHRLLSAMGEEFAVDLRGAIQSGKFYTWLIAPMIGSGGLLELHGMDSYRSGRDWGDKLVDLGQGRRADELSDGYHWMASLYQRNTTIANRTTISWIDQWRWPFSRLERAA